MIALISQALPRFAVSGTDVYQMSQAIGIYDTTYAMATTLITMDRHFTI